jgi:FAD:protein FMN transferase
MGTVVELHIRGDRLSVAIAESAVVTEIVRLEHVFSVFDEGSELVQWRTRQKAAPGPELGNVLAAALYWQVLSGGSFNPAVGVLTARWKQAQADGRLPDRGEMGQLAAWIAEPRYGLSGGTIVRLGDCTDLNFNAIAKGLIVDRAAACAMAVAGIEAITVNAGGDIVHCGAGSVNVGVEDPQNPYDNAVPVAAITIGRQGLATSGGWRRGFDVGGRWFSHVIDPRTGWPVEQVLSATVVAPDAITADAVATIASVVDPADGVALVEPMKDVGCLVIDAAGTCHHDSYWAAQAVPKRKLGAEQPVS